MQQENYTTKDYGLANWLVFNRITLIGTVEYPGDTRKAFVFLNSDRIPELVKEWGDPSSVPSHEPARTCKKFFSAHSIIKKSLKESLSIDG